MDVNAIFYTGLLVCGFVVLIIVVISGSIFFWFRHVDNRYRQCPECGELGTGYVVDSEVVSSRSFIDHKGWKRKQINLETIKDTYECEHCKHTWTVEFEQAHRTVLKTPEQGSS